jgi:hypothetical protein
VGEAGLCPPIAGSVFRLQDKKTVKFGQRLVRDLDRGI